MTTSIATRRHPLLPALVAGMLLEPAVAAARRCPAGQFAVTTFRVGTVAPPALDTLVIADHTVTLAACGDAVLHARHERTGTVVRARWAGCRAFGGTAVLKARINPQCTKMRGVVRVRGSGFRFQAARTPECGTIAGIVCPAGRFCELPVGTCGFADRSGTCEPIPDTCDRRYDPVCGCDGRTYANDCQRQAAAVAKRGKGRCRCDPPGCPDAPCTTDGECAHSEMCVTPYGDCGGKGLCAGRPAACLQYLDPVCGCDGHTFGNWCEALSRGVNISAHGPCP